MSDFSKPLVKTSGPSQEATEVPAKRGKQPLEGSWRWLDEDVEVPGQVSMARYRSMSLDERHALWKSLNRGRTAEFIQILSPSDRPKRLVKEHPPSEKPSAKPGKATKSKVKDVLWCCYCADWSVYEYFSYLSSYKCIGCGISTNDFYNRTANGLWKSDRY